MAETNIKTKHGFFHFLTGGISKAEKQDLVQNLSILLASDMGMSSAFTVLKQESNSKRMKRILERLDANVQAGNPFWKGLAETEVFAPRYISLIRSGEETGTLLESLQSAMAQQDKEQAFESSLRSALMYPIIVFGIAIAIGIGTAWYVLPKLTENFTQLNVSLPLITRILIGIGDFLKAYGIIAVPLFVIAVLLIVYTLFINPKTNVLGEKIIFLIPGLKQIFQSIELGRFGYALGGLLKAGIPMIRALDSLIEGTSLHRYRAFYTYLKTSIENGNSFQKSFGQYPHVNSLFPVSTQYMIIAAEKSGKMEESLFRIGSVYETKTQNLTKDIGTILEPFVLVLVGGVVGLVAFGIMLPIYSITQNY